MNSNFNNTRLTSGHYDLKVNVINSTLSKLIPRMPSCDAKHKRIHITTYSLESKRRLSIKIIYLKP